MLRRGKLTNKFCFLFGGIWTYYLDRRDHGYTGKGGTAICRDFDVRGSGLGGSGSHKRCLARPSHGYGTVCWLEQR